MQHSAIWQVDCEVEGQCTSSFFLVFIYVVPRLISSWMGLLLHFGAGVVLTVGGGGRVYPGIIRAIVVALQAGLSRRTRHSGVEYDEKKHEGREHSRARVERGTLTFPTALELPSPVPPADIVAWTIGLGARLLACPGPS